MHSVDCWLVETYLCLFLYIYAILKGYQYGTGIGSVRGTGSGMQYATLKVLGT